MLLNVLGLCVSVRCYDGCVCGGGRVRCEGLYVGKACGVCGYVCGL